MYKIINATGIEIETISHRRKTIIGEVYQENDTYYCNGESYPIEIVKEVINDDDTAR